MRPAKIGQLTPIDNRTRQIDRSSALCAGVLAIPSAHRAWFYARDCSVSFSHDVCGSCGGGGNQNKDEDGAVAEGAFKAAVACGNINVAITKTTTSPRSMTIRRTLPLTNCQRSFDDNSADHLQHIDSQLPAPDSHIEQGENKNTNESMWTEQQPHKLNDIGHKNIVYPFVGAKNIHEPEKFHLENVGRPTSISGTSFDGLSSVIDVTDTVCQENCEKISTPVLKRLDVTDKGGIGSGNDTFSFCDDACKKPYHLTKYPRPLSVEEKSNSGTEMSAIELAHSRVYANYFNDCDSGYPANEGEMELCPCKNLKNEQILSVSPVCGIKNRLSHQYLNNAVTAQHFPNFLFETVENCRCLLTDAEVVTCAGLDPESNMIFNKTIAKETSFIDERLEQRLITSPSYQYYNRSSVFKPLNKEHNVLHRNNRSDHKTRKGFFRTKNNSSHVDQPDHDLGRTFFPKLSHLHCPVHRSSPSTLQHQQFEQHDQLNHDRDQQQLLTQRQPRHHDRHYTQQHHHRHCSISSSVSSLVQHFKCGHHRVHVSPVSLLWTVLSVLVAGTCLLTFLTPYWTVHPDHIHSFGLFNLCIRDHRYSNPRPLCINFGQQHHYLSISFSIISTTTNNVSNADIALDAGSVDIARIPSGAWQAACLLFGVGVVVQILGAFVSLVVLALREPWHHRVALINGYMQTVGVLLLTSGLLLYPVGFNSPFYSYYCDSSMAFRTGHCAMGWSYVTAIMVTALSIFCPVMSSFAEARQGSRKHAALVEMATA